MFIHHATGSQLNFERSGYMLEPIDIEIIKLFLKLDEKTKKEFLLSLHFDEQGSSAEPKETSSGREKSPSEVL